MFASAVVLFHFANAAMLPLVGQMLAQGGKGKRIRQHSLYVCLYHRSSVGDDTFSKLCWSVGRGWAKTRLPIRLWCVAHSRGALHAFTKSLFSSFRANPGWNCRRYFWSPLGADGC